MEQIQNNKPLSLTSFLLTVCIIASPLRSYGIILGGVNFSLFRITGLLFILSFMCSMMHRHDTTVCFDNPLKIIALIWILSVAAIVYSPSISGANSNYISVVFGFFWILFFCFYLLKTPDSLLVALKGIVYSAVFPIVLGEYQAIIYQITGKMPSLPFAFLVASEGKLGLTYNVYVRITSCFGDPGYFSTCLVFVSAVALFFLQDKFFRIGFKFKVLCICEIVLSVILAIQMMSVSGLVGLAVVGMGTVALSRYPGKAIIALITMGISLVVAILVFQKFLNYDIMEGLLFKLNTQDTGLSLFGREDFILNALDKFGNSPMIGVGFGGLSVNGSFSSAHNSLLTVLGQQGLFVFILHVLILLFLPIHRFFFSKDVYLFSAKRIYLGLFAVLALSMGYDTMYSMDITYVYIGIIVVLLSGEGRYYEEI